MLTRLQMPAGKAIALAAMPTAVLMGMGLTPQLAQADPQPKGFKPGPCVSQPDEADKQHKTDEAKAEADAKAKADAKDKAAKESAKPSASPSASASPGPTPPRSAAPSADKSAPDAAKQPAAGESEAQQSEAKAPEASPSPSTSKSQNPLDPLGVGEKIEDLFDPSNDAEPSASASPSPSASSSAPAKPADPVGKAGEKAEKATGKVGGTTESVRKKAAAIKKAADEAADEAEAARKAAAKAKKDGDPNPSASDSGLESFPCPKYDADALANAKTEPTSSLLPDKPWILKSSRLALHGLDYEGIVKVKTHNGTVKDVLKFTAKSVDIKDLHQLVEGPGGTTTHVEARKGSNSTIQNGKVTMYTEELKGNLLGIIPITFSPKSPPPLSLPELFFTDVKVTQAGQFGGDLTIPGMHLYDTQG
ncbi:hydrogenase expression protein HypF [Streptomyces sp. H27-D2]|uniref:hydrogenase expression protein HypF n=1 Tax=Streptomyces sp. H27-D2 TaxID=3046304 RepID=UPI002DB78EFA|nr:hydrogenase expression protein HypF [Streptomyces sp. H27-D2]MEC4018428.1 hydrogenase expression protein HypF [Streptomyces sp. H27-D2]